MSQADPAEHQERSLVCEALALCLTKRKCRFLTRAASSWLFPPTQRTTSNYKVCTCLHEIVELLILNLWPSSIRCFCTWVRRPLVLVCSGLISPSCLSLCHMSDVQIPSYLSPLWPFAGRALVCPCPSLTGEPITRPSTQGVSQQCWAEGEDHVPWRAGAFPSTAQEPAGRFCCLMVNSLSFPQSCFPGSLGLCAFPSSAPWRSCQAVPSSVLVVFYVVPSTLKTAVLKVSLNFFTLLGSL